jgi:hypothetical protein
VRSGRITAASGTCSAFSPRSSARRRSQPQRAAYFFRGDAVNLRDRNFLNVHNAWHYALYLLQGGEYDKALEVYDTFLHHDGSDDVALELLDASALLWRLRLEGASAGDRRAPLAGAWDRVLDPGFYPFNDMHAIMTYVGAVERTLLEAAVRAGRDDLATALVSERLANRECSTYAWTKRSLLLAARGDQTGAAAASRRADELVTDIRAAL